LSDGLTDQGWIIYHHGPWFTAMRPKLWRGTVYYQAILKLDIPKKGAL
jgi:hypothetical protein